MIMILTLLPLALQEEARREWEGFTADSRVVLRITESDGEKQKTTIVRYTIVKVESDSVTVQQEIPGSTKEIPNPLKRDEALRKVGTESVDIDGKTFECALYEKVADIPGGKRTIRQWMHKDVPGRIAKRELVNKTDKGELRTVERVTRLNQRLQLGSKAITYAVYELDGQDDQGRAAKAVRWISEQVPGFLVKEEAKVRREGSPKELVRVTELVEFEVK